MTVARPVRTVFLGSGSFGLPILEAVATHPSIDLVAVVSAPDRPAGRGHRPREVPVSALARERDWPLLQPPRLRSAQAVAAVLDLDPGLLVLADYGQIVPPALVDDPRHGALNVHPSLLPRHRGASPVAATILAGDAETGVTVIRMDAGIDTGAIVAQEDTPVSPDETAPELEARLAIVGARLLSTALAPWLAGMITARPQAEQGATLTRVLRRADGRIDWSRDAVEIERHVRAYQPWPGSFTGSTLGTVLLWRAQAIDEEPVGEPAADSRGLAPGTIVAAGRGLAVVTGSGLLELVDVQLAGRRRISGRDLRNGYPGIVGERLA